MQLSDGVSLYFSGSFGRREVARDGYANMLTRVTRDPLRTVEDFIRVLTVIPSFLEAQDGFTYYWFHADKRPEWEAECEGAVLAYRHEEPQSVVCSEPERWKAIKACLEGRCLTLAALFVGNSLPGFSSLVNGAVFKVRRTRIVIELWLSRVPTADERKMLGGVLGACLGEDLAPSSLTLTSMDDLIRSSRSSRQSSRAASEDTRRRGSRSGSKLRRGGD